MDRIAELEKRVTHLENIVKAQQSNPSETAGSYNNTELLRLIKKHFTNLPPKKLIILLLYPEQQMTVDELKTQFTKLGANDKMVNWFNGGNLNQRLLKPGILYKNGKKEKKTCYSLTYGQGCKIAKELIQNLKET